MNHQTHIDAILLTMKLKTTSMVGVVWCEPHRSVATQSYTRARSYATAHTLGQGPAHASPPLRADTHQPHWQSPALARRLCCSCPWWWPPASTMRQARWGSAGSPHRIHCETLLYSYPYQYRFFLVQAHPAQV